MLNKENIKNEYALITGGSEGLGKEFALQLASLGMNLILVARNQEKLKETALAIATTSKKSILFLAADLTQKDDIARVHQFVSEKNIKIKILINNAGKGAWGHFEKNDVEDYVKMVDLNIKAPILLSHLLFQNLRSEEGSAIINVSSLASVQPIPYMSVYAATKASLSRFSMALGYEWEKHRIYVQTLLPGAIDTDFDQKSGGFEASLRKDSVQEIVKLSLDDLFHHRKQVVYAKKSLVQRLFASLAPTPFLLKEVAKIFQPK